MIEEIAEVIDCRNGEVTVQSKIKNACSGCEQKSTCASGQVASAIPQKKLTLAFENSLKLSVGDKVLIGIPEKALLQTAATAYLFPLIGLLLFSGIAQWLIQLQILTFEPFVIIVGCIGGFLGYKLAKLKLKIQESRLNLQPKIIRKIA